MDFVIVGLQAWYFELGSNCKNIALELSKHHRVLYINMPLDRNSRKLAKSDPNIRRHLDINGLAFDKFDRATEQRARDVELVDLHRHLRAGRKVDRRMHTDHDGHFEVLPSRRTSLQMLPYVAARMQARSEPVSPFEL